MYKTTAGNTDNIAILHRLLKHDGAKLIVSKLDTRSKGVVVTADFTRPANYSAKVVYWLSRQRQDALFVPLDKCVNSTDTKDYHLYVSKHGDTTLCTSMASLISYLNAGYKLSVPFEDHGFGSIAVNNLLVISKSVNQVPGLTKVQHYILIPRHLIIFEEKEMEDLSAILFGEDLYAVAVAFPGTAKNYTYKSTKRVEPGSQVVVNTPSNGLQVVVVTSCNLGLKLDQNFEHYKWIVAVLDMSEYNKLVKHEQEFVEHARLAKKKRDAIAKLAELGVTPEEFKSALGL